MAVRFFYVDESYDSRVFCLSALSILHHDWKECFDLVKKHRLLLKHDHGIFMRKEIHAHQLLGGRGHISNNVITKWQRSRIFNDVLRLAGTLPRVKLFNVCLDRTRHKDAQLVAWDRLINRIERTMLEFEKTEIKDRLKMISCISSNAAPAPVKSIEMRLVDYFRPRAVIVADEGREIEIEKALRKMHIFNPIPSRFGAWGQRGKTKSITVDRIIEDPIFKQSSRSYFIQLADCIAYALLKRETEGNARIKKYGIHKMFEDNLASVCYQKASRDPLGIVRG